MTGNDPELYPFIESCFLTFNIIKIKLLSLKMNKSVRFYGISRQFDLYLSLQIQKYKLSLFSGIIDLNTLLI